MFLILLILTVVLGVVNSIEFSCSSGCGLSMNGGLTVCTCGSEVKSHWAGEWKFTEGEINTNAISQSSNTTHHKMTYLANYVGACLDSYRGKDYVKLLTAADGVTESDILAVNGKQNAIATTVTHPVDQSIQAILSAYHCTVTMELVLEPSY
jgi:hypothetical protein